MICKENKFLASTKSFEIGRKQFVSMLKQFKFQQKQTFKG